MIKLDQKYDRQDFIDFLQESFLQDYVRDVRPVGTEGLSVIKKASSLGSSKSLDLQVFEFAQRKILAPRQNEGVFGLGVVGETTEEVDVLFLFDAGNGGGKNQDFMASFFELFTAG